MSVTKGHLVACTVCFNCGSRLPAPKAAAGRSRRYCSRACQQAAWRAAHRADHAGATEDPAVEKLIEVMFVAGDDPLATTTEVVFALRATAGRCRRLAQSGPAQLRWRHNATADGLDDLLSRLWPVP